MTLRSRQDRALEPVRAALRRRADDEAAAMVRRASDAATAMIRRARHGAEEAASTAAADGRAQASLVAEARLGRSRRSAREQLLAADLAIYQDLADRIRSAVLSLRVYPSYSRLRARLAERASSVAGAGAMITEPEGGGAMATAPGVVVDCSLGRMADRAIIALGPAIAALCEPAGGRSPDSGWAEP